MKKLFTVLLAHFLLPGFTYAQAPQYTKIEGNYDVDPASFNETTLLHELQSNLITHLKITTPKGAIAFDVKISSDVASFNEGIFYFDGTEKGTNNSVFIQCGKTGFLMSVRQDEKIFYIARKKDVEKSSFWEFINDYIISKTHDKAALTEMKFVNSMNSEFICVDDNEIREYIKTNIAVTTFDSLQHKECAVIERSKDEASHNTLSKVLDANKYPGFIGKKDIRIHMYNYGDVSQYDWGCVKDHIRGSLTQQDPRFQANRIVFAEYYGSTITSAQLPFNDNAGTFLGNFANKVQEINPTCLNSNDYHISLNRWNSWNNGSYAGLAYTPGNYCIANVWEPSGWFKCPSHELGHSLGAQHTQACYYGSYGGYWSWFNDVMVPSSQGWCTGIGQHFASQSNLDNIVNNTALTSIVDEVVDVEFPNVDFFPGYSSDLLYIFDNTSTQSITWKNAPIQGPWFDGQIYNSNSIRVYKVKLPATTYYQFRITEANYDTYLYLLDKNGNLVASDDDGAPNYRSYITGNFNNDWYYIVVGGYFVHTGSFKLLLRNGYWQGGTYFHRTNGIDMGNGNVVYDADFGLSTKDISVNMESENQYEIYPNPIDNTNFTITCNNTDDKEYQIIDLMGKTIQKGNFKTSSANVTLDNSVVKGIYMVVIKNTKTNESKTVKIMVK